MRTSRPRAIDSVQGSIELSWIPWEYCSASLAFFWNQAFLSSLIRVLKECLSRFLSWSRVWISSSWSSNKSFWIVFFFPNTWVAAFWRMSFSSTKSVSQTEIFSSINCTSFAFLSSFKHVSNFFWVFYFSSSALQRRRIWTLASCDQWSSPLLDWLSLLW